MKVFLLLCILWMLFISFSPLCFCRDVYSFKSIEKNTKILTELEGILYKDPSIGLDIKNSSWSIINFLNNKSDNFLSSSFIYSLLYSAQELQNTKETDPNKKLLEKFLCPVKVFNKKYFFSEEDKEGILKELNDIYPLIIGISHKGHINYELLVPDKFDYISIKIKNEKIIQDIKTEEDKILNDRSDKNIFLFDNNFCESLRRETHKDYLNFSMTLKLNKDGLLTLDFYQNYLASGATKNAYASLMLDKDKWIEIVKLYPQDNQFEEIKKFIRDSYRQEGINLKKIMELKNGLGIVKPLYIIDEEIYLVRYDGNVDDFINYSKNHFLPLKLELKGIISFLKGLLRFNEVAFLIHQDIKAANVFYKINLRKKDMSLSFYLGDFDLSRPLEKILKEGRTRIGNALYRDPENHSEVWTGKDYVENKEILLKQDVYSAGLLVWKIIHKEEHPVVNLCENKAYDNEEIYFKCLMSNLDTYNNYILAKPGESPLDHIITKTLFTSAKKRITLKEFIRLLEDYSYHLI